MDEDNEEADGVTCLRAWFLRHSMYSRYIGLISSIFLSHFQLSWFERVSDNEYSSILPRILPPYQSINNQSTLVIRAYEVRSNVWACYPEIHTEATQVAMMRSTISLGIGSIW